MWEKSNGKDVGIPFRGEDTDSTGILRQTSLQSLRERVLGIAAWVSLGTLPEADAQGKYRWADKRRSLARVPIGDTCGRRWRFLLHRGGLRGGAGDSCRTVETCAEALEIPVAPWRPPGRGRGASGLEPTLS